MDCKSEITVMQIERLLLSVIWKKKIGLYKPLLVWIWAISVDLSVPIHKTKFNDYYRIFGHAEFCNGIYHERLVH